VLLVTADADVVDAVDAALVAQSAELPEIRRQAAASALGTNGGAILVADLDQAVAVANWFAAEHCQLAVADPWAIADRVHHAGELLLGQDTPFSVGNFTLGGPAALPTGGYANRVGGITVERFLKSSAIGHLTPDALEAVADATVTLADHEGFPAHANTIRRRRT
jgi:histidinol dehydrogenase